MGIIKFTNEDILRSKLIEPAWYAVQVTRHETKNSRDQKSVNWLLYGKVLYNADTGDKKFADCPTPYWGFNSQAKGLAVGFFAALLNRDIQDGEGFDFDGAVGKTIDVYIENGLYNGNVVNQINHKYRHHEMKEQPA